MEVETRLITSIGGGIDLSPRQFKPIFRDLKSPRIREVSGIRNTLRTVGKVARSDDWIRNNIAKVTSRVNLMPRREWTYSKTTNGKISYSYHSNSGEVISMTLFPERNEWECNVSVNESHDVVRFSKTTNLLQVNHTGFKSAFTGKVSSGEKRVVFSK